MSKRCTILVIDKKDTFSYLFVGLRKNKFTIKFYHSFLDLSNEELASFGLVLMVYYDTKDVIELLKLCKVNKSIIIAFACKNNKTVKKVKNLGYFKVFDVSEKEYLNRIELNNCIGQMLF